MAISEATKTFLAMRGGQYWTLNDGRKLMLLQPSDLAMFEDGTELIDINGHPSILGQDLIDDTRFGYLAYGIVVG